MTIEQLIINIQNRKREQNKEPVHASFLEIQNELKAELNRLVSDKKLVFGRTINDIYFKHEEIEQVEEDWQAGSGIQWVYQKAGYNPLRLLYFMQQDNNLRHVRLWPLH